MSNRSFFKRGTPRFLVLMQAPRAPSPATLSRPMPAKSRRKSAAPIPRSRGDPVLVGRSQAHTVPGSCHGARGNPSNVADSFTVFFVGLKSRGPYDKIFFRVVPFIPGRHDILSERTGIFPRTIDPCLHPARRRERHIARQMCITPNCKLLLLLLLLCCGYF